MGLFVCVALEPFEIPSWSEARKSWKMAIDCVTGLANVVLFAFLLAHRQQ